jgi:NADPH:quinone reductase-like Zn-dependent oxidoreductase
VKAVVYDRYGPPDVLRVEQRPAPVPRAGEVLVEVVATAVNLSDWEALTGSPFYARFGGLTRPRRHVLGSDIAGRVVALGPRVTRVAIGDEVLGDTIPRYGGLAELVAVPETSLAHKPPGLGFVEASTLPQPGTIALQALARAKPGDRMLVNGAGGGTGMFVLQLAAAAGVRVTGVDSAAKLDLMRSWGAEQVIDYREEDFTRAGQWDLVLDVVAQRGVSDYRRALAPGGTALVVGGRMRSIVGMLTVGSAVSALTDRRLGVLMVKPGVEPLEGLAARVAAGEVRVHVDEVVPLERTAAALARIGAGETLGKVVVDVAGVAG